MVDLNTRPCRRRVWALRCCQRDRKPEPDSARRHFQNRGAGIQRGNEWQSASVAELNDLPIKSANGTTIYVRDVAHVRDGYPPQTNIVRSDGMRGTLMTVLKIGDVSTLDIIAGMRVSASFSRHCRLSLKVKPVADQSIFVRASIKGVVREALMAACLTAIMILVFLGSWRSTLIIAISIPLSILCSIFALARWGKRSTS